MRQGDYHVDMENVKSTNAAIIPTNNEKLYVNIITYCDLGPQIQNYA